MKRNILLLIAVAIFLTTAPAAMGSHCEGCKIRPLPHTEPPSCVPRANYGWEICIPDYDIDGCILENPCGPHASAVTPLASEFQVASVERIDEPNGAASQTLVAHASPAPQTR